MFKKDLRKLIGKEVWYTDKRKGFVGGVITEFKEDYYGWFVCAVHGKLIHINRLFPSLEFLKKEIDIYLDRTPSARDSSICIGMGEFSVAWGTIYDHPLVKKYC